MQIAVLIEPLADGRYRAQTGPPWILSAEGPTATAATKNLSELVQKGLANGMQVVLLNIPSGLAPPFPADDLYKTDWVYRELQEAIAENRRLEDAAES